MTERKRSANWMAMEKFLLIDLVTNHFSVVENKKTDGVTIKQKNLEWVKISGEYNSQTVGVHRTAENLKAQWESLKKATKKAAASARQSRLQTGGGPAKYKDKDPIFERIMGLITTSAVGLTNHFDRDSLIINTEASEIHSECQPARAKVPVEVEYIPKFIESPEPLCESSQNPWQNKLAHT